MTILFYTNWYIKQTLQLANALAATKGSATEHRVILVFPRRSSELNAFGGELEGLRAFLEPGVTLFTLDHMQGLDLLAIMPVLKAAQLVRQQRPDVVHLNESYDFRSLMLMRLCPEACFVTSVHDPLAHSGEKKSLHRFKHWIRDRIRQQSDGLIVHGSALKDTLASQAHIPAHCIHVVPHGEYRYYTYFDKQPSPTRRNGCRKILFFGRWEAYKGLDTLIAAEPLITSRYPDVRIILAGEGNVSLKQLQPLMQHPEKFEIYNYVIPDEDVPELFRDADLLVLPYRDASQSGPLHIAGLFGVPTIATRVGALSEEIEDGETGLLVQPNDPAALAGAVCALLENPAEIKRLGQNAYQRIKAQGAMEKVAQIQADVYGSILLAKTHSQRTLYADPINEPVA